MEHKLNQAPSEELAESFVNGNAEVVIAEIMTMPKAIAVYVAVRIYVALPKEFQESFVHSLNMNSVLGKV